MDSGMQHTTNYTLYMGRHWCGLDETEDKGSPGW